ncbi:MAG: succinylglutamate desuccinylase [Alphaproteobacteria bacterium TMED89]|nr:succinylglutamate desuccinylase [Rhodospirillaceae bacterium]RPH15402.1 MAG: succinylglutamate desuccinylase [Alphaproteobacteria bacterium TMED89]
MASGRASDGENQSVKNASIEDRTLKGDFQGTSYNLRVFRFGSGKAGAPKAYMHAALHADETPGMLILHHMLPKLQAAAEAGLIDGEIVVLPQANPLGGAQVLFQDTHIGRFDLATGQNHNRGWELLPAEVVAEIETVLSQDEAANVAHIRRIVGAAVAAREPNTALERFRKEILLLSHDADIVFDIHCDDESGRHLFIIPEQWPDWEDIARASRSQVALTAADSGGGSYDECLSTVWTRLQARFPNHPIPLACPAATFEYAGRSDVEDDVAAEDAQHLFSVLCSRGFINMEPTPLPDIKVEGLPLEATDMLRVNTPGILTYRVAVGDEVTKGQHVADIIDPTELDPAKARTPIHATTDGFILSRRTRKLMFPGESIMKIVGREILDSREGGYLLED